ncbi:MAG: hypothetical protein IJY39_08515 [Clostridia bacterium]|nr:hypothetical protein [Clostridia bacterium]
MQNSVYYPDLVGNLDLKKRLSKDVGEGFLSHAYILEGPRGTGRHTLALQTVAALSCEDHGSDGRIPCGKCKSCDKILNGKSPDVITVGLEGEKVTIGVETVRNLKNDMFTAPNDLTVKAYIIEDADRMTAQAQNAFLLSLEEPPSYILFFLLCENSANLLETVRSRAPTLRLERIEKDPLAEHLLAHDKRARSLKEESEEEWHRLLCVSAGSIGYALELLETKRRRQVFDYLDFARDTVTMLAGSAKGKALSAIAGFGNKRPEVIRQLSYIQYALRDLILLKKSENAPLCFFEDRDRANELSTRFTSSALFALYDATAVALDDLERNANVRLTLMNMMQNAELL